MATLSDQRPGGLRGTFVNEVESPPRQPPILLVGPLAWIKNNLFNTIGDAVLTLVVGIIVAVSVIGLIGWTIAQANWYAVTFNLRLIMLGRYEPEAEWRVTILVILSAFVIGLALAAWARVRQWQFLTIAVVIALLFILPAVITTAIALPPWYGAAGSINIGAADGPMPISEVTFLGRTGETITLQMANQYANSDESLAQLHSFADPAAAAVLNLAVNRLSAQAQLADLTARLESISLTDGQRARLEAELGRITVPEPAVETLRLNQEAVEVAIINGATGETVGSATLDSSSAPLEVTLPADGWYILSKTKKSNDAISILEVRGIYPILERTITRGGSDGSPAAGSISQYVRMTDGYLLEADRPAGEDGRELPFAVVTQNQYRGNGTFPDYLRLYVAPFLNQINVFFLVTFIATTIGYLAGRLLDSRFSPADRPRVTSTRTASWSMGILFIAIFIGVWGFSQGGVLQILAFAFALAWLMIAFFAGGQLPRPAGWIGFALAAGVALLGLLRPGLNPIQGLIASFVLPSVPADSPVLGQVIVAVLLLLVTVVAVVIGRSQARGTSQRTYITLLIIGGIIIGVAMLVAQPLADALAAALPLTDTRRWGGVLLTMLLTVVGIIGSLPLGILLALGRRSKAPVISTICTLYIEIARGVPFITVLFMAQLLIPLIDPSLADFPGPFRAMIATVIFTAAYNAEVIRGGLQAIPPGQEEAAKAVGLSGLQTTLFITLPQALRLVIPPMMGNFVGMFKDTSLVAIVGLLDVLGMAQNVIAQTEFLGLRREMFLFVVIFYFVICYIMAVVSRRIEESGAGAAMSRKI
ncbi:MAG TPA: amino acid ABC transporter permease [Aggregatilineales bacterium]|nr:amino acid ABC transporter permease [Aggregatilineales bacterium]